MKTRLFTNLVLSAALILTGLPLASFGQGNQANAQINITAVKVRISGNTRVLEISWDVNAQGGAVPQKFDVRADAKIFGGGNATRSITLNGDARFTKLGFNSSDISGKTNTNNSNQAGSIAEAKEKLNQTKENAKGTKEPTLTKESAGKLKVGDNSGNTGNASSPINPGPATGANGGSFVIESANVTVTGRFRGGNEAVALTREFVPPATNPTGELKPRSGNNAADVALTKVIDLKKSPRASQCAAGRDCFEVFTAANDFLGNGGKGFTVNLEVLYADGSRQTDAKVLNAPGRSVVMTVNNPNNKTFSSVRVSVRGEGDGQFTRKATRNELL